MFASHTGPLLNATRLTMRLASCRVGTYARHEFQLIPEPMPVQFRAIKKSPLRGFILEAWVGIEPAYKDLQSSA